MFCLNDLSTRSSLLLIDLLIGSYGGPLEICKEESHHESTAALLCLHVGAQPWCN